MARDRGKGTPLGPRPGAHGFGSFCRNKRISACGAETPQNPPPQPRLIRANKANVPSMYGIMHVYTTTLSGAVPVMAACRV